MKKKVLALFVALGVMCSSVPAYAANISDASTKVFINNAYSDAKLKNVDGYNYISVEDVRNVLNYTVKQDDNTKPIIITNGGIIIVFVMDSNGYIISGEFHETNTKPVIIDDKVYVPLRDMLRSLHVPFVYSEGTDTLVVSTEIYTADGKKVITSEEYSAKLNQPKQYNYNYIPQYNYQPYYNNSTIKARNNPSNEAAQAQQAINKQQYDEACRQAYIDYEVACQNAVTLYNGTGNVTAARNAAYDEYMRKLERYKIQYGM